MLFGALAAAASAAGVVRAQTPGSFSGRSAGNERDVDGIKLCWCPAGRFTMGSPRREPERRPGEDQVEVTLTRGFWMAKYEVDAGRVEAGRWASCRAR